MKHSSENWSTRTELLCPAGLLILCTALSLYGAEIEQVNRVVAKVGDESISSIEVDRFLNPVVKGLNERYTGADLDQKIQQARQSGITKLINDKLLLLEANNLQVTIPDAEITKRLNAIRDRFTTEDEYNAFLKENKLTTEGLRTMVDDEIKVHVLLQEKIAKRIRVLPSDIHDYYQLNVSKYFQPANVHMYQIMIKKKPTSEEAYQRALSIYNELKDGANFQQLARLKSEGPKKNVGGDWGIVEEGFFGDEMADVEKAAFALDPGQFSPIVESKYGYHIAYVSRKRPSHIQTEREAYEDIYSRMFEEKFAQLYEDYLQHLRTKTYVEVVDPSLSFSLSGETGASSPDLPGVNQPAE